MPDFALITGGPVYRFLGRFKLQRTGQHIALASLLTWFPLLLFTCISEATGSSDLLLRFVIDPAPHVRFLLAVPILLGTGPVVDRWLSTVLQHLKTSGIINPSDSQKIDEITHRVVTLRDSWIPEIIILAIAYANSLQSLIFETRTTPVPWLIMLNNSETSLRLAGWWYYLISMPLFGFLITIWAWRFLMWAWVLWRISRLELQLIPTHPDEAGGLEFLTISQRVFSMIAFTMGAVISASIWQNVLYRGANVIDFRYTAIAYPIITPLIILAPLTVFAPDLIRTHYKGLIKYSALANKYTESFDDKWIQGQNLKNEELLGSSDIQSLADLANSFAIIRRMRVFPFTLRDYTILSGIAAIPFAPLVITVIPAKELLQRLIGLLF